MSLLDKKLVQKVIENHLHEDIFKGLFGLEKENIRVCKDGKLALTPHPKAFGIKSKHPYIKADFSESQVEMITPACPTIEEAYHFLETIHNVVSLEIEDEYLWPSSNPPILPQEDQIAIADMGDPEENEYRMQLVEKYGRKKQLLSGIHYNFSFQEVFLRNWFERIGSKKSFRDFKDEVYLKVARNVLKYRWFLIYLTGASPVFHKTYEENCIRNGERFDEESMFFPNMCSLRNSKFGYRNTKPLFVSFASIQEHVDDLRSLIKDDELISFKEFYSPVRLKPADREDPLQSLLDGGVAYLELRFLDLNPFERVGITRETLTFIHLFLIYMLLIEDKPFGIEEQKFALLNQDLLAMNGIKETFHDVSGKECTLQKKGLQLIDEMEEMIQLLAQGDERYLAILQEQKEVFTDPSLSLSSQLKREMGNSSFIRFHLNKSRQYAEESRQQGYKFSGYEDLELSTQLLLKAAVRRGIKFEILDRKENFVVLKKGNHWEYVKQATKTSLDSYITVLIMENKIVTKKVLEQQGIRVPKGKAYHDVQEALADFGLYEGTPIVIKPKSTNFGLGISIFKNRYSKEDYKKAFEIAFEYDKTVLLEEFLTGKEYRFLVMGDEVVGVLHRVPANVMGDGVHTVEELVHEKNKDPRRGKGHKTPLEKIQIGEIEELFLKNQGKSRDYIPKSGEVVFLRENSNISTGGDSIDFTDDIPDSYKQIAIKCAKAAGATFCGVDMMIDDIKEDATETNYGIIEINFNPAIHIHCYPYKGKNRKADEKILDLLFGSSET